MTAPAPAAEPARPGDLAAIRALLQGERLPQDDLTAAHLEHFIVLRDGAAIAAVAGFERHGRDGLLRSVAVAPALRQRGLGVALVEAIEARARMLRLEALFLLTTTAAEFFERRGYRRIERGVAPQAVQASREFSALCPSTAICMVKTLHLIR